MGKIFSSANLVAEAQMTPYHKRLNVEANTKICIQRCCSTWNAHTLILDITSIDIVSTEVEVETCAVNIESKAKDANLCTREEGVAESCREPVQWSEIGR